MMMMWFLSTKISSRSVLYSLVGGGAVVPSSFLTQADN